MPHVSDRGRVNVPVEKAWAVTTDLERYPQWQSGLVEVRGATGALDQVGTRYTSVIRVAGRPIEGQWEVTQVEPNRLLELTGTAPGGGRAVNRVTFEEADGATDVAVDLDYELPGGFVGQLANRAFVERAVQSAMSHSMENFKAICEEGPAA